MPSMEYSWPLVMLLVTAEYQRWYLYYPRAASEDHWTVGFPANILRTNSDMSGVGVAIAILPPHTSFLGRCIGAAKILPPHFIAIDIHVLLAWQRVVRESLRPLSRQP